jgi:uracil-DNA glycosylase
MTIQIIESKEPSWSTLLAEEFKKPYLDELMGFIKTERQQHTVYPPVSDVFNALYSTPYSSTKVVLLGQDPYHGPGQANGYCFSVRWGQKLPPSLRNIYQELQNDLGIPVSGNGCLKPWAKQGVLLLNTSWVPSRSGMGAVH